VKSCEAALSLKIKLLNVVVLNISIGWTWGFLVEYFAETKRREIVYVTREK
jgi:hypothetical protein